MKIKGWASDIKDRIEYYEDGTVDEAVMVGANVHMESLSDDNLMLIIENNIHRWHFHIGSRSGRAKVDIVLNDETDIKIR